MVAVIIQGKLGQTDFTPPNIFCNQAGQPASTDRQVKALNICRTASKAWGGRPGQSTRPGQATYLNVTGSQQIYRQGLMGTVTQDK